MPFKKARSAMIQDTITQRWVKLTGRKMTAQDRSWLMGPIGGIGIIKYDFIQKVSREEGLEVLLNPANAGLLESIEALELSPEEIQLLQPQVVAFYEQTSNYDIEIWSEWRGLFRPFGKGLSLLFSKRLQQLNIPLRPLDSSRGVQSDIIKLLKDGKPKWTVWYRTMKQSGDVIYSGVYTTVKSSHYDKPLLKVIFPLPNGSATVVMTPKVLEDGSLLLSSDGKKHGQNGFYFTLTDHNGTFWSRYVRSLHEWIRVYVDEDRVLRADHNLKFFGINFLNLHYKMVEKR